MTINFAELIALTLTHRFCGCVGKTIVNDVGDTTESTLRLIELL